MISRGQDDSCAMQVHRVRVLYLPRQCQSGFPSQHLYCSADTKLLSITNKSLRFKDIKGHQFRENYMDGQQPSQESLKNITR